MDAILINLQDKPMFYTINASRALQRRAHSTYRSCRVWSNTERDANECDEMQIKAMAAHAAWFLAFVLVAGVAALDNGVGRIPAMGYNTCVGLGPWIARLGPLISVFRCFCLG